MKRAFVTAAGISASFAVFCGGKSIEVDEPSGILGPDGNFLSPDGSPVYAQGAACEAYDAASFDNPRTSNCEARSDCLSWATSRVPAGYPEFVYCAADECFTNVPDVNNHQVFSIANTLEVHCAPGATGDAFCTSYLNQFVMGSGHTTARCIQGPDFGACSADRGCWDQKNDAGPSGCDDVLELCVSRNGMYVCERPCAPP